MKDHPIPYGRQYISQEDIDTVVETLKSDYLTQGPKIAEFEEAFANYIGSEYAIAVSNGTAALHLCALALGTKEGDKVITTPITFAASANCVRYCGGEVVFADIDPETFLLDIKEVEKLLEADTTGAFKGIIPVDFAGRSVDMEAFRKLADKYNLWIIEDSCHAPGAYFIDEAGVKQLCGNGKNADLSIFSFHPVKHIAAGEGGMITTNNEKLYKLLKSLRAHGITKEEGSFENDISQANGSKDQLSYQAWYMEMQTLGYNYRITDFQSALGISQLERAPQGLERRKQIAKVYQEAFKGKDFIRRQSGVVEGHAYHLYVLEVEDRTGLYDYLRSRKVYTQIHYIPCHLMPYYSKLGWKKGDFPHAEAYYNGCISLPMYPTLTEEEQQHVIAQVLHYYEGT